MTNYHNPVILSEAKNLSSFYQVAAAVRVPTVCTNSTRARRYS
jgi:hypothetical protein